MNIRPRRLRRNNLMRDLAAETRLHKGMFMMPYFVIKGEKQKESIASMPGISRLSIDLLLEEISLGLSLGLNKVLLFGVGEEKSEDGASAASENSVIPHAIKAIKEKFGDQILVATDVCLCAYTTHGHCGILDHGDVKNDITLDQLANMALSHANAGADIIAPSDMMDGRVEAIREMLDDHGFENIAIMSYSVKYASAYYGPFRDAADSAPGKGDRKSYQMDFRNSREALKEAYLDEEEGADILMVKPALAYLDIIQKVKENTLLPLAAYNVSAEYSMVKAAAAAGYINEQAIVLENMYAFRRAGADLIITYHAMDLVRNNWL